MGKIKSWMKLFQPKLKKHHGNHWKKNFDYLMRKSTTLKASLKKRSRDNNVSCDITVPQIRQMMLAVYGKKCNYCNVKILRTNMVCDHIIPISHNGNSSIENLQLICARCNTRKGPLTHIEYKKLMHWLNRQQSHIKDYIFRKLSKGDVYR